MFILKNIKNHLKTAALAIAAIGAGMSLVATPVLAAGESYSWQDATDQAIVATGGAYGTASYTLTQSATNADSTTFSSSTVALTCDSKPTTVTVSAAVATADQATTPTPASISVTPACADANLDSSVTITAPGTAATAATTSAKECDQGSMSWLACPTMQAISGSIAKITEDVLVPLLKVNSISQQNTPGLYSAWSGIKNFAEVLFIILFLVTIFSTALSFGLDQYTIKRMLPRLIAAAILIQFSFLICSIVVDLGNVLGAGIQTIILGATPSALGSASTTNDVLNIGAIALGLGVGTVALVASWALALPILLMMLISALGFLLTLAARYVIIALLVAVSPLAIIAWVLPNTAGYFKKWFTTLIKLILMYPIIVGILAIAGRINEILGFTSQTATNGVSGGLADILKPFIIIAVFLTIPRTFKWAGGIMETAHSTLGNISRGSNKKIKGSDWYKDQSAKADQRRLSMANRLADTKAISSLSSSKNVAKRAAGGFMMTVGTTAIGGGNPFVVPSTPHGRAKKYSGHVNDYAKEMDTLESAKDPGMLRQVFMAHYGDDNERKAARQTLELMRLSYCVTTSRKPAVWRLLKSSMTWACTTTK